MMAIISIAEQFCDVPSGRYPENGDFNGTTFRQRFLVPAIMQGEKVVVNIDGLYSYASSFFDEALAGLCRPKADRGEGLDCDRVARLVSVEAKTEDGLFFLPEIEVLLPRRQFA